MIRKAQEKDIDKILDLLRQVARVHHKGRPDIFMDGTKYVKDELKLMLNKDLDPIFVYTDRNDLPIGYAFCNTICHKNDTVLTDIKTLYIDDLCVDIEYRGQGIGTKLYEYVKEYAKENLYYNVTLNVWELNPSAKRFYEHLGLHVLKTYMEEII